MKQKAPNPLGKAFTHVGGYLIALASYGHVPMQFPEPQKNHLHALRLYYLYRQNGFVLLEALDMCVRNKVVPPGWVLEPLNSGFQRFEAGSVTLQRALALSKRNREEFNQYRSEHKVMGAVRERVNADPKRKIKPACVYVANRRHLNPETLEKAYRRFWRGFFDYVSDKSNG